MIDLVGIYITVPLHITILLILGATISVGAFIFHIAVVPLVFKYSKTFRRTLVFANFVQWPFGFDFDEPSQAGLEGARNLSVEYDSKVDKCKIKIGIWHILPKTVHERLKDTMEAAADQEELNKILDQELASTMNPIFIYLHGNSSNRATFHRVQLYKFLQRMDFHVIAFDYRGYADSTKVNPSEAGVVEDSLVVYEWLLNITRKNGHKTPIFVWGHSLGTGISSSFLGNLDVLSETLLERAPLPLPNGLILEAPFSSLADEVAYIPVARQMVTWLPYFDMMFVAPFRTHPEQLFRSDENLKRVPSLPVLILHAKDDYIVPFVIGLKLYRSLVQARQDGGGASVEFHGYEKKEKLGHRYIVKASNLQQVLGNFVNTYV